MTKHCTGDGAFLATFQATKPNGNSGAAEFSKSDRLFFFGFTRDGDGVDEKRARHMEQGFPAYLTGFRRLHFSSCKRLRGCCQKNQLSPIQGQLQKTHENGVGGARLGITVKALRGPVYKAKNLENSFLKVPGIGKVLLARWQSEEGKEGPLTRPWVGTTQQGFSAKQ